MPNTVSWNLQLSVREGRLDDVRNLMNEMVVSTLQEPGTLIYEWFLSEDGKTCHLYERYADNAAAMVHATHFGTKFADRFLACLEPTSLSVYGELSPELRAAHESFGANFLDWLGGFHR